MKTKMFWKMQLISTMSIMLSTIFNVTSMPLSNSMRVTRSASLCDPSICVLPTCRCAGADIPGNLTINNTPQMILFTMDDGITAQNFKLYQELLKGGNNSNGCPIKATFFVSGDNTDYNLVKSLYESGHEIADHSVTHKFPEEWWKSASYTDLEFEIVTQMNNIQQMVGATTRGWRTPFLATAENTFQVVADKNFLYDSSIGAAPLTWPYTLNYFQATLCETNNCPQNSYSGLWEVPLTQWQCDESGVIFGTMVDECEDDGSEKGVFDLIMRNFNSHYKANKQPFPIFGHSPWFEIGSYRKDAMIKFIAYAQTLPDVFFVTMQDAVQWTQSPVGLDSNPFSCL